MKRLLRGIQGPFVGAVYVLGERTTMGRAGDVDIQLLHPEVSRRHAKISRRPDGSYVLLDLASDNGTLVDEDPIDRHVLRLGERIRVHQTVFEFAEGEAVDQTSLVFHRRSRAFEVMRPTVVSSTRSRSQRVRPRVPPPPRAAVDAEHDVIVQDVDELQAGNGHPAVPEIVGVPSVVTDDPKDVVPTPIAAGSLLPPPPLAARRWTESSGARTWVAPGPVVQPVATPHVPSGSVSKAPEPVGRVPAASHGLPELPRFEDLPVIDEDRETEALQLFYTDDDRRLEAEGTAPAADSGQLRLPEGGLVQPSMDSMEAHGQLEGRSGPIASLRPISVEDALPASLDGMPMHSEDDRDEIDGAPVLPTLPTPPAGVPLGAGPEPSLEIEIDESLMSELPSRSPAPEPKPAWTFIAKPQARSEPRAAVPVPPTMEALPILPETGPVPVPVPADELPTRQIVVTDLMERPPSGPHRAAHDAVPYAPNYEPPPGYPGRDGSGGGDSLENELDQSVAGADGLLDTAPRPIVDDGATRRYDVSEDDEPPVSPRPRPVSRPAPPTPREVEAIDDRTSLEVLREILDYRSLRIRRLQSGVLGREDEAQFESLENRLHLFPGPGGRRVIRRFRPSGRVLRASLSYRGGTAVTTCEVKVQHISVNEACVEITRASVDTGNVVWLTMDLSALHRTARSIVFKARVAWVQQSPTRVGLLFAGPAQYVERPEEAISTGV